MAVLEDELAGEDDESLRRIAIEGTEAVVKQLGELGGLGGGRCVVQATCRVKGDAGLCSVGDDEADVRLCSQGQEGIVVCVGVHCAADAIDELQRVHGLAVNEALQVDMIETVLRLQTICHALCDGLDDDDRSIEIGALVHLPHNPIDECAKKVAFAKLYDALGALRLSGGSFIKGLHID